MTKAQKLRKLFFETFRISACTFGGGFVIVPLLRKKFVEQLGWIDDREMLDLIAITQSSPGAVAVNASILIGYRTAGIAGALVTIFGTIIPPFAIISVISLFYRAFRDNKYVSMAMAGMLAGVTAVIFDVVITMCANIFKQKQALPVLIMAGAFAATYFFKVNIFWIILACAAVGAASVLLSRKKEGIRK